MPEELSLRSHSPLRLGELSPPRLLRPARQGTREVPQGNASRCAPRGGESPAFKGQHRAEGSRSGTSSRTHGRAGRPGPRSPPSAGSLRRAGRSWAPRPPPSPLRGRTRCPDCPRAARGEAAAGGGGGGERRGWGRAVFPCESVSFRGGGSARRRVSAVSLRRRERRGTRRLPGRGEEVAGSAGRNKKKLRDAAASAALAWLGRAAERGLPAGKEEKDEEAAAGPRRHPAGSLRGSPGDSFSRGAAEGSPSGSPRRLPPAPLAPRRRHLGF